VDQLLTLSHSGKKPGICLVVPGVVAGIDDIRAGGTQVQGMVALRAPSFRRRAFFTPDVFAR